MRLAKAPLVFCAANDTTAFQEYVDQVLVRDLKPGDVPVFDNLKARLAPGGEESSKIVEVIILPLPPYSSHYKWMEKLWSKFKGRLRAIGARTKEHLYQSVGDALDQVTVKDILGWFNDSGVYPTQS